MIKLPTMITAQNHCLRAVAIIPANKIKHPNIIVITSFLLLRLRLVRMVSILCSDVKGHREPGLSAIRWSRLLRLIVFSSFVLLCSQLSEINHSRDGSHNTPCDTKAEPREVSQSLNVR